MPRFKITYTIKNDEEDTASVWVDADNVEDAKREAKREHWDIADIIATQEIK